MKTLAAFILGLATSAYATPHFDAAAATLRAALDKPNDDEAATLFAGDQAEEIRAWLRTTRARGAIQFELKSLGAVEDGLLVDLHFFAKLPHGDANLRRRLYLDAQGVFRTEQPRTVVETPWRRDPRTSLSAEFRTGGQILDDKLYLTFGAYVATRLSEAYSVALGYDFRDIFHGPLRDSFNEDIDPIELGALRLVGWRHFLASPGLFIKAGLSAGIAAPFLTLSMKPDAASGMLYELGGDAVIGYASQRAWISLYAAPGWAYGHLQTECPLCTSFFHLDVAVDRPVLHAGAALGVMF